LQRKIGEIFGNFFERISPKKFARKKHSGPEQLQSERSYNFGQSHPHQQLGRGIPQSKNSTSFWRWHLIRFAMALSPSIAPIPLSLLLLFVRGYIDEQF
jgi:hypothetical protein